jgi:hypothetical protein
MSHRQIDVREAFGAGVLRATREQVDAAVDALTADDTISTDRIEEAREHLRRAWALLGLTIGTLPRETRRAKDRLLRDALCAFSPVRDRHALWEIAVRFGIPAEKLAPALERSRASAAKARSIEWLLAQLAEVRQGLDGLPDVKQGFGSKGLLRTYRKGRNAMRRARSKGKADAFDEWRTRALDLCCQMEFLAPLWPGVLDAACRDLASVTDRLGDASDVGLLMRALEPTEESARGGSAAPELLNKLEAGRAKLWQDALAAGARLYADSPEDFVARMKGCWKASRRGDRSSAAHRSAKSTITGA